MLSLGVFEHGVVPGFAFPVGVGVAVNRVVHLEPLLGQQTSKACSHLLLVEWLVLVKSVSVLGSFHIGVQVLSSAPGRRIKQLSVVLEPRSESCSTIAFFHAGIEVLLAPGELVSGSRLGSGLGMKVCLFEGCAPLLVN